jgi:hypothetical protein
MPTFLDILVTLLTILIALIPLNKDVILKKDQWPNKGFFQRITASGWMVIIFALVILFAVFYKDWYLDGQRATEIREQNKHFDEKISDVHERDSIQNSNIRHDDSIELQNARDSIISEYSSEKKALQNRLDSAESSHTRHLDAFHAKRLLQRIKDSIVAFNFIRDVGIVVGGQSGNEEATNFAVEIKDFLIKKGYHAELIPMMYMHGGGGFKIGKDGDFLQIDVGLITKQGLP